VGWYTAAMMRLIALLLVASAAPADWPGFRGSGASGVADGQKLPLQWDAARGANVRWKVPIAGLAHSSPVVWGRQVFLTTAVSSKPDATFKRGLYGAGTASDDLSPHTWKLLCIDAHSGKTMWERAAYGGVPKEKRHIKSTYANATPATDGRVVVAFFGSQGLYAYDLNGKPLWHRDLGRLDAGAYDAPDYEWGTASSPILFQDLVIVQADQQRGSFLIALNQLDGRVVWRTERDELPSWATPAVIGNELVTNAPNFIRGYDPRTGRELWRLGGSSKITAPTPIASGGMMIVASGRRPEAPIFAIRQGSGGKVVWSRQQRGPYMPTPLIMEGLLYVLGNAGVFDCYELESGAEVYRERVAHSGSGFSASPVASDGRIILSGEDGEMFVVKAGRKFEVLAKNEMGEAIMATPAIAGGQMLVRTERHLWAVGSPASAGASRQSSGLGSRSGGGRKPFRFTTEAQRMHNH
jgi:outer membrane protein assembly factor BamB